MKTRNYSGTGVRENGFAKMHWFPGITLRPLIMHIKNIYAQATK
jgi:hypothetical protein